MSHFTTTVIVKKATDPDDAVSKAEKMLAPFDENLEVPHEVWYPSLEEALREVFWWRSMDHLSQEEKNKHEESISEPQSGTKKWLDWLKGRIEDYQGYKAITRPATNGDVAQFGYISTHNPNSQWDWHSVGGRWRGFWPVKPGTPAEDWEGGTPGVGGNKSRFDADVVRKGDVDFDYRLNEITIDAERDFTAFERLSHGLSPDGFTPWDEYVVLVKDNLMGIDEARQKYGSQEIVAQLRTRESMDRFGFDASPDDFFWGQDNPRERYVHSKRVAAFSTFALLDEKGWQERGNMGWFGMVKDEKDIVSWAEFYQSKIDDLPEDAWLVNMDLHI